MTDARGTLGLGRLYGSSWDTAPPALRRAALAVVVQAVVALVAIVAYAVLVADLANTALAEVLLVAFFGLLEVGLAGFLLRRSRVVWLLLVALRLAGVAFFPPETWEVPAFAASTVVLVLLLVPRALRAVWFRDARHHPVTSDVQRSD